MKNQIKISNNNKEKIASKRITGIDMIRLLGMYGIIINHILYVEGKGGMAKYYKYSKYLKLLHILTFWHNNGFALISGIIGFKTNKYSNLIYLWLMVVFYSIGINLYFQIADKSSNKRYDISKEIFPIIYKRYWYFTSYFGFYLYLPIINKGISLLNENEFRLIIISIIFLFVFWRDIKNPNVDVFGMKSGFSVIWLLTYYLIGAYIGKNKIFYSGTKKYIYCLVCLLIYASSSYLFFLVINNQSKEKKLILFLKQILTERYDSILKVTQSISLSLFFLQINFNKYISKIICFLGPLIFGIYIIHNNYLVTINILKHSFDNEPNDICMILAIILVLFKALKIFIICVVIDYLRHLIFLLLRIKKICIYIELRLKIYMNIIK